MRDVGIHIPTAYADAPLAFSVATGHWSLTGAVLNFPAMVAMASASILLLLGITASARINNVIVVIKAVIVILFVAVGVWFVRKSNWVTAGNPGGAFVPTHAGPGQFGWSGVVRGAAVVFFAYIGFDAVSTAAQEARNPQRDMPIGIIVSLVISTVLYVLVSFVLTGIVAYDKLNVPDPIAVAVDTIGVRWLSPIVKVGAVLALSSVILVSLLGQTRVFYAMARDGPATGRRFDTSALANTLCHDGDHRRYRDVAGRRAANRHRRRARQHRNALCLRHRLFGCAHLADDPT
jgi:basic amino acid/polyamine antiporter, APA family